MRALEVTGTVDHSGHLHPDQHLTAGNDQCVRVIVLSEELQQAQKNDEEAILMTSSPDPFAHFIGVLASVILPARSIILSVANRLLIATWGWLSLDEGWSDRRELMRR